MSHPQPLPPQPDAIDAALPPRHDHRLRTVVADLEQAREARLRQIVGGLAHDDYLAAAGEVRGLEHAIRRLTIHLSHAT